MPLYRGEYTYYLYCSDYYTHLGITINMSHAQGLAWGVVILDEHTSMHTKTHICCTVVVFAN